VDENKARKLNVFAKKLFEHSDRLCWATNSWARVHIEAEEAIPEEWRNDFYDELTSENLEYRKALEESVRWFGVRWA
jgi:hypothetical protein